MTASGSGGTAPGIVSASEMSPTMRSGPSCAARAVVPDSAGVRPRAQTTAPADVEAAVEAAVIVDAVVEG